MKTHNDIDFDFKYCSSCKRNHCRKDFCSKKFTIRLGGLEGSLTSRIYELLWSHVEIELDNGYKIKGILSAVGFNFVEIHIDENSKERAHEKGQSSIFTIDKIMNIKLISS